MLPQRKIIALTFNISVNCKYLHFKQSKSIAQTETQTQTETLFASASCGSSNKEY